MAVLQYHQRGEHHATHIHCRVWPWQVPGSTSTSQQQDYWGAPNLLGPARAISIRPVRQVLSSPRTYNLQSFCTLVLVWLVTRCTRPWLSLIWLPATCIRPNSHLLSTVYYLLSAGSSSPYTGERYANNKAFAQIGKTIENQLPADLRLSQFNNLKALDMCPSLLQRLEPGECTFTGLQPEGVRSLKSLKQLRSLVRSALYKGLLPQPLAEIY